MAGKLVIAAVAASSLALIAPVEGAARRSPKRPAEQRDAKRPHRRRPSPSVTIEWVGDMAMSTQLGLPPGGVPGATAPERSFLHDADLTIGNLEGTLSQSGPSKCGGANSSTCFAFQAPPWTAVGLRSAGFELVNQANNHSNDFGATGRDQTLAALDAAGVAETGLPGQITLLRVGRGDRAGRHGTRVALLGFAPYSNTSDLLDIPAAERMVEQARREAQIVVVIIHAGAEGADRAHTPYGHEYYLGEDRGDARAFAHAVIRAGASLVLGSGPHVIRGVELYRGRLIAYSLGNFIGYHTLGGGGTLSLSGILQVTVGPRGGAVAGRWFSIALSDGLPFPDPSNAAAHLVAGLSSQDFPGSQLRIRPDGRFAFPAQHRAT